MIWLSLNFPDYIKFHENAAGACRASGAQFIRFHRNQSNFGLLLDPDLRGWRRMPSVGFTLAGSHPKPEVTKWLGVEDRQLRFRAALRSSD